MRRFAPALAVAALLGTPASAEAHSVVRIGGNTVTYLSADATSLNTLIVRTAGQRIEFSDRTVDGGIDPGSCDPGAINQSTWIVQVFCSRERLDAVRIDLGEREDRATIDLPLPVDPARWPRLRRAAGRGRPPIASRAATAMTTWGPAAATTWSTAVWAMTWSAAMTATTSCAWPTACWTASSAARGVTASMPTRSTTSPSTARTFPAARSSRRRTPVRPTTASGRACSPAGTSASGWAAAAFAFSRPPASAGSSPPPGFVDVGGISIPIQSDRRPVTVAGGGVELTVRLKGGSLRRCRRAVQRGRPCSIRMWVVGTDLAGNSTRARPIRIRLRR